MIQYEEIIVSPDTIQKSENLKSEVEKFRSEGPLDSISAEKLREHFRAGHIYHSAGIEGNRLTLQETMVVLKEGITISEKPLKESIEVQNLGVAFDYLNELGRAEGPITAIDIRNLHSLIIGNDQSLLPGQYRKGGVIIAGAEHRPPEPIEVPGLVDELISWINLNKDKDPFIVSAVAHHELAKIHPFADGNGRTARLLLNLILLRNGMPICNIRRDERPSYYNALALADDGNQDAIINIVIDNCNLLFSEYMRIREETKRMSNWAQKWGTRESEVILKREKRNFELWQTRINQIVLEFKSASEYLDEEMENMSIVFNKFPPIDFENYQKLVETGFANQTICFTINFEQNRANSERFMFRFFRNWSKFPPNPKVVPLELNHFSKDKGYIKASESIFSDRIRLREIYFTDEGEFRYKYLPIAAEKESDEKLVKISDAVQMFFDDILKNIFHIT